MIDSPPSAPGQQVIARKLSECGLERSTVSVKWEDELQSFEVVIRRPANVSAHGFACIHEAAATEIVTFENPDLQAAYGAYTAELYRPRMIAEPKYAIRRLGLIDGFPRRADFSDMKSYAEALERHCGFPVGSALHVSEDVITINPPGRPRSTMFKRLERIITAITYAQALGDIDTFGFIGNGKARDDE